jgi:hypothetical protein
MGSLRSLSVGRNVPERPISITEDEFKEITQWVWDKIRPRALYCDIDTSDRKMYDRIEEILTHIKE